MRPHRHAALALAFAALLAWTVAAPAADDERGRILYETRCGGCHAASVHGRAGREARDYAAVRRQVRRWSDNLHLDWSDEEVSDVSSHLNARYYRFACPPAECKATGSRDAGGPRLALDGPAR